MARKPKPPEGLRDQIAIRAMELIIGADPRTFLAECCKSELAMEISTENVAKIAYVMADAMLEFRSA